MTNFSDIDFNSEFHTYRHRPTGQRLTSVTKKIGEIKPPFDAPAVAAKVVAKKGGTVEGLLAEWEVARTKGQELGKRVHRHIESMLRGTDSQVDPFVALNGQQQPEIQAFNSLWTNLRPSVEIRAVEWVVGDIRLGIAGTVDSVLYNPDTDTCHIWDWKTGKKFGTTNPWERLLAPFAGLDNCELSVYSLQTSLYRLIIERNTDMQLGDSYLVHLASSGLYEVHKAIDLRGLLSAWLLRPELNEGGVQDGG